MKTTVDKENKEEYAKALAAKAEKCVTLMKRFVISALVLAAVLAVFSIIIYIITAFYTPADDELIAVVGAVGFIIILACLFALIIAVIVTYASAKSSLNKLDALDKEK